jgi:DnaJ-class molecular chaperone
MPGYGAADPTTGHRGDQLVHLKVELPTTLQDEDIERVKALEESLGKEAFPKTARFEQALLQGAKDD